MSPLSGKAKVDYQRVYMQKRRAKQKLDQMEKEQQQKENKQNE
jgi:hypothetical protein